MKRFIKFFCLLLVLCFLVGCAATTPSVNTPPSSEEEGGTPTTPETPKQRVKLMFEIEGGAAGSKELIYKYRDDLTELEKALDNIYNGLEPLMEDFDVVVQIYPTWHYRAEGYNGEDPSEPLNRISPELKFTLNYFRRKDIPFYLEMHSSGIRTNQNGELGTNAPAALHYGDDQTWPGLPMDMDTVKALREEFDYYFEGIRFHELIGTHSIGLSDRAQGNEEYSHGFVVQEEVVKTIIDTVAETGLKLVWSDHSWNVLEKSLLGRNGEYGASYDVETAKEIKGWLDYAVSKLQSNQLTLNWANNGWPIHQYIVDDFLLKNYKGTSFGASVQDWFWQELDCSTMQDATGTTKWYIDADLDCPPEIMAMFTLRAIEQGASLIQFEPIQYFFNSYSPRNDSAIPVSSIEDNSDYSAKLTLKRFIDYILEDGSGVISTDPTDYYDTDYNKYVANKESDPPKRYYQNTLYLAKDGELQVYDKYNSDYSKWYEQSENRLREYIVTDDVIAASRIALAFSCGDEIMVAKQESGGVRLEFYNYRSGRLLAKNDFFADNEDGKVVDVFSINLISDYVHSLGGDADEIVLVREKDGALKYSVYSVSTGSSTVTQDVELYPAAKEISDRVLQYISNGSAAGYVKTFAVRTRNAVLGDMTRPVDTKAAAVYAENTDLKVILNNGESVVENIGKVVACCPVDINGDFIDEIAAVVEIGGSYTVKFIDIETLEIMSESIALGSYCPDLIFGCKIGTYLKGF